MKVNAENLTGAALDWVVANIECEGVAPCDQYTEVWLSQRRYSTDWEQSGPIIEREGISIYPDSAPDMPEVKWSADAEDALRWGGPTPLIAAMRAYVVSKLGSEVDVPDVLVGVDKQH